MSGDRGGRPRRPVRESSALAFTGDSSVRDSDAAASRLPNLLLTTDEGSLAASMLVAMR
jgi:hypothetical protein